MTRAWLRVFETDDDELKTGSGDDRNYCLKAQGPIGSTHPDHDPEKWIPVFGKDHAQITSQSEMPIQPKIISLQRYPK
jgi:hypothetical protein